MPPRVHYKHHSHEHEGWEGPEPHRRSHRHRPIRHRHALVVDDHHATWPTGTAGGGDLAAYAGIFWSTFVAATMLPGASEVLLVALLVGGTGKPWIVVAAATVGNALGSVANWACGRFLGHYRDRKCTAHADRPLLRALPALQDGLVAVRLGARDWRRADGDRWDAQGFPHALHVRCRHWKTLPISGRGSGRLGPVQRRILKS